MHLKQYEIVTQPQFIKGNVQDILKSHRTVKQWAYILHDKDDATPHYHIYLNFGSAGCDSKDVAGWFGLEEQCVQKVEGRKTDMLLYLTHGNESQKNKHQYNLSEVIANFDFASEVEQSKIVGNFDKYSYAQQLKYVEGLSVDEKPRVFTKLKKLWELHCTCLSLNTDRKIGVVFITGKGGTGKTYYAKKLLASMGYDFSVSSSSNDPFQDYLGQKSMILDDLRSKDFEYSNLLKILDNNTSSSVESRFHNKVFNGDLIVITSSIPLRYWYKDDLSRFEVSRFDSLQQLYRRISTYVEITYDHITVFNGVGDDGNPCGIGKVYENELKDMKKEEAEKIDVVSAFDKICKQSEENF